MQTRWLLIVVLSVAAFGACGRRAEHAGGPSTRPTVDTTSQASDERKYAELLREIEKTHFVPDRSHAGEMAPTAVLTDAGGGAVTLRDLRGKPTLVNFWAHWCAPCRAEMPTLSALAESQPRELLVATVNEDSFRSGKPSLGEPPLSDKIRRLADPKGSLLAPIAGQGLPTTVYYGRDGRERWRLIGALNWTKDQAARLLAEGA